MSIDFHLHQNKHNNGHCCLLSCPPLENVSEHLQVQGSEVQDSHKAIVKDLADVRHQAQDIYQKIGNQNGASQTPKFITEFQNEFRSVLLLISISFLCG